MAITDSILNYRRFLKRRNYSKYTLRNYMNTLRHFVIWLDVPIEELLNDPHDTLSPRVLMRARMLRVMKTAQAMLVQSRHESERRMARLLIGQLIEIMPELEQVAAWPAVGHRRIAWLLRAIKKTAPDVTYLDSPQPGQSAQ